jgi:hypothetical protein
MHRLEDLAFAAASAASPSARAEALDGLAYAAATEEQRSQVDELLVQALSDLAEAVRAQALETLKDTADEVPAAALARVASQDAMPELRARALEILIEREGEQAHESLRLALEDSEPLVRERARELVEDLHIEL